MKIVFFSNFINHHQVGVADELYRLTGGNYYFVCTQKMPESFVKNGYPDFSDRSYIIELFEDGGHEKVMELIKSADVTIFGVNRGIRVYRDYRIRHNMLTFQCGERWLKRGIFNLLSPHLMNFIIQYHLKYRRSNKYYALNMSAFAARDLNSLKAFNGKCYKWAYFTPVRYFDIASKSFKGNRIMWCNRFIKWKHPEMAVLLAKRLKIEKYDFHLDMYGDGCLMGKIKNLISKYDVGDVVSIHGACKNDEIRREMENHDILLTTSDRHEGWGTTVNEGMSSGCVVIGADEVGSVPFLIKDGVNGLIFKSGSLASLYEKVLSVLTNPVLCSHLATNAYNTISQIWSPKEGANRLYSLCERLLSGQDTIWDDGPCSRS